MVHFSGKARKMNHTPILRERSERVQVFTKNYSRTHYFFFRP
ncbi:MAG: hypothetical protein U5L45_02220 [Saprospiraceae bacterium]|nr:hypothetical protein [Saprospiraceae bacterium]